MDKFSKFQHIIETQSGIANVGDLLGSTLSNYMIYILNNSCTKGRAIRISI
jgi:hypothetical protein